MWRAAVRGPDFGQVSEAIKNDPYFIHDETLCFRYQMCLA